MKIENCRIVGVESDLEHSADGRSRVRRNVCAHVMAPPMGGDDAFNALTAGMSECRVTLVIEEPPKTLGEVAREGGRVLGCDYNWERAAAAVVEEHERRKAAESKSPGERLYAVQIESRRVCGDESLSRRCVWFSLTPGRRRAWERTAALVGFK